MTHPAIHPPRSSSMIRPLPGLLALLVAIVFATLISGQALANNDNDCIDKINTQITTIDRRLRHKLITQTEIMSVLTPLALNEGACLTKEQRTHLRDRIRSTDTLRVTLSIAGLVLDINACLENGDITDEQYTAALLQLESLLVTASRISTIQFRLLDMLAEIPDCE